MTPLDKIRLINSRVEIKIYKWKMYIFFIPTDKLRLYLIRKLVWGK
jgi:hypothetical protein